MKNKNRMITSPDTEKYLDKIQNLFLKETLKTVCIDGTYHYMYESLYMIKSKPISYRIVKSRNIPPKIRNKTRMPILSACIQRSTGSSSHKIQTIKINKRKQNWKGRSKLLTVFK